MGKRTQTPDLPFHITYDTDGMYGDGAGYPSLSDAARAGAYVEKSDESDENKPQLTPPDPTFCERLTNWRIRTFGV